jgi:hypothetical protein
MKTLRKLVAVGLLLGSYHVGMAQSNSVPAFKTDAEKQAWVKAHPELQPKQEIKRQDPNVRSNERFANDAEKQVWLDTQQAEADAQKEANPAVKSSEKRTWAGQNHSSLKAAHTVKSTEKYASETEKVAALKSTKN